MHAHASTDPACLSRSHMYLTTRDVRSKDDATVDLHVMIFFRCVDLERMLMNTNDTTSDIINGAAADLQQYGSQRTYEQLLADSGALSVMEHYPILAARLASIGYELEKVVYRGYSSSDKLQSMQDSSIASRTKLRLDADTKRHEMANQMMELSARQERQKIEHEQDEARALHETKMRALRARAEQEERDELHQQHVRHQAEEHRVELEHAHAKNRAQLTYLDGLRAMGVDLSAYLVAKDGNKADYQILCGGAPGGQMPQLHLDVPRPA